MIKLDHSKHLLPQVFMNNYLFYDQDFSSHYSIGAIVLNEKNQVMCHHFKKIQKFEELYILMRETPEINEGVEQTLKRGLLEEFGAEAEIIHYTGSIVSHHDDDNISEIEKTTLYFLCRLENFDINKRQKDDPESSSEVSFMDIDELITKSKDQGTRYSDRSDLDESKILLPLKKYINKKD